MIIAILIIVTFIVNCLLLVYIRQEQEEYHRRVYKIQHHMWDDITQIGRTVRAIDKKIEDSTVYKTELRFMDNKKN
jgi:hypothetical protein